MKGTGTVPPQCTREVSKLPMRSFVWFEVSLVSAFGRGSMPHCANGVCSVNFAFGTG